jgi:hypothetical protein
MDLQDNSNSNSNSNSTDSIKNPSSINEQQNLINYDDFIFLRGGVANIQTVQNIDASTSTIAQPSIGAGIKIKNVTIDYALTNFTGAAGTLYSNIFSLKLNFIRKNISGTTITK